MAQVAAESKSGTNDPNIGFQAEITFAKLYTLGCFRFKHCLEVLETSDAWKECIEEPKQQHVTHTKEEVEKSVNPIGRDKAKRLECVKKEEAKEK